METNRLQTVPYLLDMCDETGRTDSLRLEWNPGDEPSPHQFWDSDIAKSIESVAYSVMSAPDPALEARADRIIELLESAQEDDGYLNSYFQQVKPEARWTNLRDDHELYCAGHLIEAAVAYSEATGKGKLLCIVERYLDLIEKRFGTGGSPGYPGHEEIELALCKLYRATGRRDALDLAKLFIDRRGTEPNYFRIEAEERGETRRWPFPPFTAGNGIEEYFQAHKPVREQNEAVGHSVRACYLYTGMADVAAETGDRELYDACLRLWRNIVDRRMYVTGGIGSHRFGERFSADFDLPNEEAYAESCAAIALAFFAQRLLNISPNRAVGDVLERVLYNAVLSGISLDGTHFFYANPLAAHPVARLMPQVAADPVRQEWYGCACCPPNLSRVLGSLGTFAYSQSEDRIWIHLFVQGSISTTVGGLDVTLSVSTAYPWDDRVRIGVECAEPVEMEIQVRVPRWCSSPSIAVQAQNADGSGTVDADSGYWRSRRVWSDGDSVELILPMEPVRLYADPRVRHDAYSVTFLRGPLIYCFEEADNGADLASVSVRSDRPPRTEWRDDLFGGVQTVTVDGRRRSPRPALYNTEPPEEADVELQAIPYAFWAHRGAGEMRVWLPER